jgi:hypothetical protein
MLKQGYTGLIYDYDFSSDNNDQDKQNYCLSQFAYNCNLKFNGNKNRFVNINFQDIATSSQVNPIAPRYIKDRAKLSQYTHLTN